MNQHYDGTHHDDSDHNNHDADELEKRLYTIGLARPSEKYLRIPEQLASTSSATAWLNWRWLSVAAAAIVIASGAILSLSTIDSGVFPAEPPVLATEDSNPAVETTSAIAGRYMEGMHYTALPNPIGLTDGSTTEVSMFFWYPCWPCSSFEEHLAAWESDLPADIILTRIPAIWSAEMRFQAQAYYTAQLLGVEDETHRRFYTAFQKNNSTINSEQDLQLFFEGFGVSALEFMRLFHSDVLQERIQQAEQANNDYQIQSTPSLFVAGKYAISPQTAGGLEEMLEVADYLLELETQRVR